MRICVLACAASRAGEYLIFYRIEEDDVVPVMHVIHGSRDVPSLLL
jgi:plasmid stabilization system protein ParE